MPRSKLLLVSRRSHKPRQERTVFNQGLPAGSVPVHVLRRRHCRTRLTAEQYNDGIGFGWNEAQKKHILRTAIVAFKNCIAERRCRMKLDLLMTRSHQMIDDVRRRGVSTSTTEPLAASQAPHHAAWIMDTTVTRQSVSQPLRRERIAKLRDAELSSRRNSRACMWR